MARESNRNVFALVISVLIATAGLALVWQRGGLLAWLALVLGGLLITRSLLRPGARDALLAGAVAASLAAAWLATLAYVLTTYESGEVVELIIDTRDSTHTARVWTFEHEGDDTVYYDAMPAVATSLLDGEPVQFVRADQQSERIPEATRAEVLSESEAAAVLSAMAAKYKRRMLAADIYYVVLGRPRDRIALVVRFPAEK